MVTPMTEQSENDPVVPAEGATNVYATKSARYYAVGLLTIVYMFNFIDRQLLAILQESIKADLDLMDWQLGLLTGFAFALFYVIAGIPIARWADRSHEAPDPDCKRNDIASIIAISPTCDGDTGDHVEQRKRKTS